MRVVIDTSVLVSAAIRDRLPEQVLLWCVARPGLDWLVTAEILEEYIEVVNRPKFGLESATVAWWVELIGRRTRMVTPQVEIAFPRDRKDAKFLICALSGDADLLITGDGDFKEARTLIRASIVNVRQFAQCYMSDLARKRSGSTDLLT
ncbi:putative toxin-antitoxin system toxin component, PIN family [Candidatus Thiosymbion oneisti]|uniref:putative toxin-antitoxin system toxin component, PIN family n=1 Tax=Candidatus Thiosymbion oneisti TaxID=589554 RepID=UPI000B7DCDF2|nr:putative toxin-antitoxin system toxin component, PIN family [Candidatus Thiosymbion oneisti]